MSVYLITVIAYLVVMVGISVFKSLRVKDQKDLLADEREQFELRMSSYEQILRDKYLGLDQTVAKLNQTGSALIAMLGN